MTLPRGCWASLNKTCLQAKWFLDAQDYTYRRCPHRQQSGVGTVGVYSELTTDLLAAETIWTKTLGPCSVLVIWNPLDFKYWTFLSQPLYNVFRSHKSRLASGAKSSYPTSILYFASLNAWKLLQLVARTNRQEAWAQWLPVLALTCLVQKLSCTSANVNWAGARRRKEKIAALCPFKCMTREAPKLNSILSSVLSYFDKGHQESRRNLICSSTKARKENFKKRVQNIQQSGFAGGHPPNY